MIDLIKAFIRDEKGASAVEYALLVAGIAVAIMGAVFALGGSIQGQFTNVGTKIGGAS
jgi:pilus assembly protein Flp/PilA